MLLPPTLASCTGGTAPSSSKAGAASFGSNASDPTPKNAYAAFVAAFEKKSGDTVKVNTSDHNSFQEKINNYLQGSPDDAFTWFAGYRMQYFAKNGLLGDVSDVWSSASSNYSSAMKDASTADDGKQYFVPNYNYPWGLLLPEVGMAGERVRGPDEVGRLHRIVQEDAVRRSHPDPVRR